MDSFDYDYHLLWDCNFDLGGYRAAQVLFEDMKNLKKLGVNGMVSCQVQRAAFPTALGMSAMAATLWKREQSFDQVSDRYLKDVFDSDWEVMKEYFKNLSEWFHPPYLRLEEEQVSSKRAKGFAMLSDYLQKKQVWFREKEKSATEKCDRATWKYLCCHADVCILLANVLEKRRAGTTREHLNSGRKWFKQLTEWSRKFTTPGM